MEKDKVAGIPPTTAEIRVALGGLSVNGVAQEDIMAGTTTDEGLVDLSDFDKKVLIFESGIGPIQPTSEVSNRQLVETVENMQVPVSDKHIVCIDERESAEGKQPPRRKTAGGPILTGFAAVLLNGGFSALSEEQSNDDPLSWFDLVAQAQVDAGVALGGHTDNHSTPEDPACGAAKKLADAITAIGENADDHDWMEMGQAILGDLFDKDTWHALVQHAKRISRAGQLSAWQHGRMLSALKKHGGVIEVLDGNHDALKDPQNLRHNHWGEGINVNHRSGFTNDRDASPIPFFQVDVDAVVESVRPLSRHETEFTQLLHGAVLYNLGVAYVLTKNQRITQTGA